MAVDATHHDLFSPPLIQDRELMNVMSQGNGVPAAYSAQQMRFLGIPSAAALPENQFYHHSAAAVCEGKTSVNTDSGVTYNNISAPRKRSFAQFNAVQNFAAPPQQKSLNQLPTLAGDDIMPQIQQYQFEIDAIISQHTKKIRIELEERQKQQSRLLAAAIGEGVMKKLKEKDEQIQRMGKLNFVLQERVKSLYVENQLWRDLAQTNEATANSLRSNLEQVLQHVGSGGEERIAAAAAADDDAESCCGSNDAEALAKDEGSSSCYSDRRCRLCGDRQSCVLLLPCRHLCLCSVCGSGSHQLQSCPVCNVSMTATLHVNMS
ncbi:RING-type E3 ubiquitin transferase [Salvia divinorum]|uniref:RING-type E3 ubiquitin transferase n=1 Tax=Salvia divinorum TaxID=28513 RepID=A0ABD1G617_SALDI